MIKRRTILTGTACIAASALLPGCGDSSAKGLRLATVKYGSLNWLVQTIRRQKLAEKAGLDLEIVEVASNQGGPVALLSDEADVVVSDWTWAMRQRSLGEALLFSPYSSTLGAVMVHSDGNIATLADLKGKRLGVAGSSIDKSWLLLRAYARKVTGTDMAELADPVFGSPPLLSEEFRNRRLDGVLNFWTYTARLIGEGHTRLVGMKEILTGLEVSPVPSLVGFVWKSSTQAKRSAEIDVFFKVVAEANALLATSEAAWDDIRPLIRAKNDAEFAAIKAAYRSGIPKPWTPAQTAAAKRLFDLLVKLGDKKLVGHGTKFDAQLFHVVS
ncbi:MAG: transporter substrate-binding domain-containing protein [Alphaproteobacteria bacterium]|nr:transporter substrate-binding domain-containing protein [Alphaproteobacteria bacterium]